MRLFDTPVSIAANHFATDLVEGSLDRVRFEAPPLTSDRDSLDAFLVGTYPEHSRKGAVSPDACHLLAFDVDNGTRESMRSCVFGLTDGHGLEVVAYTTHSHTPVDARYRLLIPLTRAVTPVEYKTLSRRVDAAFDIGSDAASFKPKQLMYLPARNPALANGEGYRCKIVEGEALDPDTFLSTGEEPGSDDDLERAVMAMTDKGPVAPPPGVSNDAFVAATLAAYSPVELDYPQWYTVVLAVAHQLDHADGGVDHLINWTKADGKNPYWKDTTPREIATKYRTEGHSDTPATLRSILNRKSGRGTTVLAEAYATLLHVAATPMALETLLDHVSADRYCSTPKDARRCAAAYIARFKEIVPEAATEDPPRKAEIANLIRGVAVAQADEVPPDEGAFFHDGYVIQRWDDRIRHIETGVTATRWSFNTEHRTRMPPRRDGVLPIPLEVLAQGSHGYQRMRFAEGHTFDIYGPRVIETDRGWVLNRYVPGAFPEPDTAFDPTDEIDAAVADVVERHLLFMGNCDPMAAKALTQWLAHIRQHPHTRAEWGVSLLSSAQGIGKTTYARLAECVLGKKHVASVPPEQASQTINEWQSAPVLLTFIEEPDDLANRPEARISVGSFKSFMTEHEVKIRRHNAEWVPEPITTRLAITSNNVYTMGPEITGRRWLTSIISRVSKATQHAVLGCGIDVFFARYRGLMDRYPDRFAAYFDSVDLADFNRLRAPVTVEAQIQEGRSPQKLIAALLDNATRSGRLRDIAKTVVYKPALVAHVQSLIDDDDADLAALATKSASHLSKLAEGALLDGGYRQLGTDRHNRLTARFDATKRPRASGVYVHESVKRGTDTVSSYAQRAIDASTEPGKVVPLFDEAA